VEIFVSNMSRQETFGMALVCNYVYHLYTDIGIANA